MEILYGNINDLPTDVSCLLDQGKTYFSPQYCQIVAKYEPGGEPFFYFLKSGDDFVYYQFVKRDIAEEVSSVKPGAFFDIITPFDFGGYCYSTPFLLETFFKAFTLWCKQNKIVSEFIRFNPLYDTDYTTIGQYLRMRPLREQIYIDLRTDFYAEYADSRKRNIKKAQKTYEYDFVSVDMDCFYEIYCQTMARIDADNFYYFDKEILQKLVDSSLGRLFGISLNDKVVAAMLVIEERVDVYYQLGGTLHEHLQTNLFSVLIDSVANYYKNRKKKFLLGGGSDSIYMFKKRFSGADCRAPYVVGMQVHDKEVYDELTRMAARTGNTFFPAYRHKVI